MRLFRVSEGGATYWVLSDTGDPADVQAAIEEVEGGAEWRDSITSDDIREIPESEARVTICQGDDEPDMDLWTAALDHQHTGFGRVVACSEWP